MGAWGRDKWGPGVGQMVTRGGPDGVKGGGTRWWGLVGARLAKEVQPDGVRG